MIHTNLPIYKKGYDLTTRLRTVNAAIRRVSEMPAEDLFESANSYFGLLRQATNSHSDRCRLANTLRRRGHCIAGDIKKTFRRKTT